MIRVSVTNSANNGAWVGTFPDSTMANAWIAQGTSAGWWGSPAINAASAVAASYSGTPAGATTAITITATTAGSLGNIALSFDGVSSLTTMIANWNTANPSNQLSLTGDASQIPQAATVTLTGGSDAVAASAGYVIAQTDITAQYAQQQAVQTALQNQSVGATIIANVAALNESLLAAGTMTQATFATYLADQNVLNIERLLWNGSLVTAKALIQSTNLSAYYTADQVNTILALFPA